MTARLFVHPACVAPGPRQDSLQVALTEVGLSDAMIGPASLKGYRELVWHRGGGMYERMDRSTFHYESDPAPRAA